MRSDLVKVIYVVINRLTVPLCISNVPGSNPEPVANYIENFLEFFLSFQANTYRVPQKRSRLLVDHQPFRRQIF
jgi:hypothetical protein